MFDDLKKPEDIFAQTDKEAPKVKPPTTPTPTPTPTQSEPVSESAQPPRDPSLTPETIQQRVAQMSAERSSSGGGGMKVVLIILTIIVIIGAAFYLSWRILTSKTPVTPAAPEELSETNTEPEPSTFVPEPILELEQEPVEEIDTDQDGLTDTREQELGTDVSASDTDKDGLFDREEVEVYMTDPLNPDSDGDTYPDGSEVKGGYDPNGPGKLLEVPNAS